MTSSLPTPGQAQGLLWKGIGTSVHFRWLKGIVASIFVMNIFDGLMTVMWVFTGLATEANPMMDPLLETSPGLFMASKLALVGLGSVLLWRTRRQPMAVIAIFALFMVYYLLMMYHLAHLDLLF